MDIAWDLGASIILMFREPHFCRPQGYFSPCNMDPIEVDLNRAPELIFRISDTGATVVLLVAEDEWKDTSLWWIN